jgi:catechol 2,3-dioxygenase-like lactoylglutathione lyase family enzyme
VNCVAGDRTPTIRRVLDHLSIQCADVMASASFYDAALRPLGGTRVMQFGSGAATVIGYGAGPRPTFWLGPLTTGEPNREIHVAFEAPDRDAVTAFQTAAVGAGAELLHEARVWPEYHPNYFGAFVRDPDGNNVEAVCHTPA